MNISEKLENTVQEAVAEINKLEVYKVDYAIECSTKSIIVVLSNTFHDCVVIINPDEQDKVTSKYIFDVYFSSGE